MRISNHLVWIQGSRAWPSLLLFQLPAPVWSFPAERVAPCKTESPLVLLKVAVPARSFELQHNRDDRLGLLRIGVALDGHRCYPQRQPVRDAVPFGCEAR